MRILVSSVVITLGIAANASPVAAAERAAQSLTASGPWQINFADDKCQLARGFGDEKSKHILIFEQFGPDRTFSMTVAGKSFAKFTGKRQFSVQFGEKGGAQEISGFTGDLDTFGSAVIFSTLWLEKTETPASEADDSTQPGLAAIDLSSAKNLKNVTISQKKHAVRMMTGNLAKPLAALNTCSEDLVRAWGFDPEKQKRRDKGPTWTNAMYVTKQIQQKYPSRAVRVGEQGIFRMRVTVDADGTVSECVLLGSTKQDRLKSPACGIMRRSADFEPAVDQQGEPMRSYYNGTIVYRVG